MYIYMFKKGSLSKASQLWGVKGGYESKILSGIKQGQQKLNDSKDVFNAYVDDAKEKMKSNPLEKK